METKFCRNHLRLPLHIERDFIENVYLHTFVRGIVILIDYLIILFMLVPFKAKRLELNAWIY
jgi:hypothetical protein